MPIEGQRHSRFAIPINVTIDALNGDGEVTENEPTVTENISYGGASVFTSLTVEIGSFINISSPQYHTTLKAIVRGRRIGPDGIPRLHLEFVDKLFPLSGIE